MRKLLFFLLLPAMAFAQFGHGTSGGTTITQVREAIADSSYTRLDDADTLTTRGGRDLKVPGLLVTGPAKFESNITARGNMTLSTTPLAKITADSGRFMTGITTDGGIRAKTASQFGATATPLTIGTDGSLTASGIGTFGTGTPKAYIGTYGGDARVRLFADDGDSLSVWDDGSTSYIKVKNTLNIDTKGSLTFLANSTAGMLIAADDIRIYRNLLRPLTTDYTTLGNTFYRFKELWFTDNGYIGGKGQTAALTIGQQKTMTEQTDSTMVLKVVNGEPIITLLDGAGNQGLYATGDQVGIGTTAPGAKMEINGSKLADSLLIVRNDVIGRDSIFVVLPTGAISTTAATIGASNFTISAVDTVFTTGYVPRWVKFTSGGKSWYSPVYADTTGKW